MKDKKDMINTIKVSQNYCRWMTVSSGKSKKHFLVNIDRENPAKLVFSEQGGKHRFFVCDVINDESEFEFDYTDEFIISCWKAARS